MKIISILLLLSGVASARSIQCSSFNQNLTYVLETYAGGPAPRPDQEMSREKIVIGNLLDREIIHYNNGTSKGTWDIELKFSNLHILQERILRFGTIKDYTSKLTVIDPFVKYPHEFFVICQEVQLLTP